VNKPIYLFIGLGLGAITVLSGCAATPEHQGCYVAEAYISGTYTGPCDSQGRAHGQGVSVGEDSYKGQFNAGVIDGWGLYTWSNGATYCGQFKDGALSGLGIFTTANGTRQEGIWENNALAQPYEENRLSCTIR
jgi:hypothetical protein